MCEDEGKHEKLMKWTKKFSCCVLWHWFSLTSGFEDIFRQRYDINSAFPGLLTFHQNKFIQNLWDHSLRINLHANGCLFVSSSRHLVSRWCRRKSMKYDSQFTPKLVTKFTSWEENATIILSNLCKFNFWWWFNGVNCINGSIHIENWSCCKEVIAFVYLADNRWSQSS